MRAAKPEAEVQRLHRRRRPGRRHRRPVGRPAAELNGQPTVADQRRDPRTRPLHDPAARGFASDNYAGVHPEVLAAIAAANGGHQVSYGDDVYTAQLQELFRQPLRRRGARRSPSSTAPAPTSSSLQAMTDRWDAVICAESAHINVDECGAPEKIGGLKLLTVPTPDGKLTPELIDRAGVGLRRRAPRPAAGRLDHPEHRARHRATPPTRSRAICEHAHERGMRGAPGRRPDRQRRRDARTCRCAAFTTDVGVDVLSFGGTKNGLMFGEAIVVLNPDAGARRRRTCASRRCSWRRRCASSRCSSRRCSAGDLWLRNASARERDGRGGSRPRCATSPACAIPRPVQANAVFAVLPAGGHRAAAEAVPVLRLGRARPARCAGCTSFDTTEADVDAFAAAVAAEMGAA